MDSSEESRSEISDFGDVLALEMRQETGDDLVACESCGECFSSLVDHAKHLCAATADPIASFDCRSCARLFPTRECLIQHAMTTHSNTRMFECPVCAMPFTSRHLLLKHSSLHYGPSQQERRFVCGSCSEVFSDQRGLSLHLSARCKMQQFPCPICTKVFVSHGNRKKHILVHTGTQRFECPVCTKSLTNRGNLTKHMMIHTGVRPYKCEVCGRAFTLRRNLKEHLLIHQGIRPYTCTTCGKTFTQLSNLNQHLLIHAGIQDYPCELCGKCFTLRGNLKKHILIHAQEYAFSCKFCGKAFTLGGNLKKHLASKGTKCYKMNGRPDEFADTSRAENTTRAQQVSDSGMLFDAVYAEVTVETEDGSRPGDSEASSSGRYSGDENNSDASKCGESGDDVSELKGLAGVVRPANHNEAFAGLGIKEEFVDGGCV